MRVLTDFGCQLMLTWTTVVNACSSRLLQFSVLTSFSNLPTSFNPVTFGTFCCTRSFADQPSQQVLAFTDRRALNKTLKVITIKLHASASQQQLSWQYESQPELQPGTPANAAAVIGQSRESDRLHEQGHKVWMTVSMQQHSLVLPVRLCRQAQSCVAASGSRTPQRQLHPAAKYYCQHGRQSSATLPY